MTHNSSILSIAPYPILPPTSGGKIAITQLHQYISKICPDHVVSTENNADGSNYSFDLHTVLPASVSRYVPFIAYKSILNIAKRFDSTAIICEHPYMAPAAMMVARALNIPWYIRSHNIEAERFRQLGKSWWKALYYFEQFAMRKANGVFFITPEDAAWARAHYEIPGHKCHFIPFGTKFDKQPAGRPDTKKLLQSDLGIKNDNPLLYFMGALDYAPNTRAVIDILNEVQPRLEKSGKPYQIIIAGKGLPQQLQQRIAATNHIVYAGFVEDLDVFLHACDIMLNATLTGGGVKTKAVEALSYGKIVVSTQNGAYGLVREICGANLHISEDNDWEAYVYNVIKAMDATPTIPQEFYQQYYLGNIAQKVLGIIKAQR